MTSAPGVAPAPIQIQSIHFDFPNGQAVRLRDHQTNQFLGHAPEWDAGGRNELVAFVRATRPQVRVVFLSDPANNGVHVIGADETQSPLTAEQVNLVFDPVTGLSGPVLFTFANPLPDAIGRHKLDFHWHSLDSANHSLRQLIGITSHSLCTTWRASVPNISQKLEAWVYSRLVEWTCQWAAGQTNEKAICDAIITNLASSGLCYGVRAIDVRAMLIRGGGMCGVWYQMFQQMAHSQGVFVHRRCFLVDWRLLPNGEEHWCALVICSGGINQPGPTHPASEFHDHDGPFPDPATPLLTRFEKRYRFWGNPIPDEFEDGHCVNFLTYAGRLLLYDACFATGPIEIQGPLPPDDRTVWAGNQLASFKAQYLDSAVDYMLGSLYNGGHLVQTDSDSETNGVTVRTAQIRELVDGQPGLTFAWGE